MNVFRHDGDYVFALTYGSTVDWVRNVLAAGGAQLVVRGKTVELTDPELISAGPDAPSMPPLVRFFLGLIAWMSSCACRRRVPPRPVGGLDPP